MHSGLNKVKASALRRWLSATKAYSRQPSHPFYGWGRLVRGSFGVVRSRTLADASLHEEPLRPFGALPLRRRGFEWLPCEGELSAKLTEGFFQRCVSELRESCGSPYSAFVCLFESRTTANEPRRNGTFLIPLHYGGR